MIYRQKSITIITLILILVTIFIGDQSFAKTTISATDINNGYVHDTISYIDNQGTQISGTIEWKNARYTVLGENYTRLIGPACTDEPSIEVKSEGLTPYSSMDRHLSGEWTGYITDNSYGYGDDPSGGDILVKEHNASDYGFTRFIGWTLAVGQDAELFTKHRPIQNFPTPSRAPAGFYDYIHTPPFNNGAWDFWWHGWTGRAGQKGSFGWGGWDGSSNNAQVHVELLNNGKKARVTRTVNYSSQGYTNIPLAPYGAVGYTIGNEWTGRFGSGKDPSNTNIDDAVVDGDVEHRRYGMGELLYFFGVKESTSPSPTPKVVTKINLIASMEELEDPDSHPWITNPITKKTFKAGYGIPLVVEVQGYNYEPQSTGCAYMTSTNNDIEIIYDSSTWVKIDKASTDLDSYIYDRGVPGIDILENTKDSGIGPELSLKSRWILIPQTEDYYPLKKRKIYTNPVELDGDYKLAVSASFHITYTENYVSGSYCCEEYCRCACCPIWDVRTVTETVSASTVVEPTIEGSMFDDDSAIIYR